MHLVAVRNAYVHTTQYSPMQYSIAVM